VGEYDPALIGFQGLAAVADLNKFPWTCGSLDDFTVKIHPPHPDPPPRGGREILDLAKCRAGGKFSLAGATTSSCHERLVRKPGSFCILIRMEFNMDTQDTQDKSSECHRQFEIVLDLAV